MNNIQKELKNEDGSIETLVISSNDNESLNLRGNYKLANSHIKKESKLAEKFKGSILGSDIGVKSGGFSNVAILAAVIALAAIAIMYFVWRF